LADRVSRVAPLIGLALDELGWNTQKKLRIFSFGQQSEQATRRKLQWVDKITLEDGKVKKCRRDHVFRFVITDRAAKRSGIAPAKVKREYQRHQGWQGKLST
jgi:hypothetical protein